MAKRRKSQVGFGKLLDAWVPPDEAGDPIGCLATTFTFDAAFFEEQCLASFLGLESDPTEDGPVYLIEREEKLAKLSCAGVLVDAHHCRGERSLRWDLLPARLQGIQHAKVSLLVWAGWVRLMIGSANLTEDGYRRNLELFGVLDYFDGGDAPIDCLTDTIGFLRRAVRFSSSDPSTPTPAMDRWNSLLRRVETDCLDWGSASDALKRSPVRAATLFVEPSGVPEKSCFGQLKALWPAGSPPSTADVVSPFFDPPEALNAPAKEIWTLLRKRGDVSVGYHVTAEDCPSTSSHQQSSPDDKGRILLHAPESLLNHKPRDAASVELNRIDVSDGRPLHAKGIWLADDRWAVYQIGSSNFTSAGMGIAKRSNLEANLVYIVDSDRDAAALKSIEATFPKSEVVDVKCVQWKPLPPDEDECGLDQVSLPSFFGEAVYSIGHDSTATVTLALMGDSKLRFRLTIEGEEGVWFDSGRWNALGRPAICDVPWERPRPPSGFEVRLDESPATAWWPVNVQSPDALPPPQELRNLPLEVLIDLLSSARPLHRVLGDYLKRQSAAKQDQAVAAIDPHKRVDTSGFLLQRTRRLSWALSTMRERIERPAATIEMLRWRLHGPVGVMALADAISREAKSEEESSFLLAELALELARANPTSALACVPSNIHKGEIHSVIRKLDERVSDHTSTGPANLRQYVQAVFKAVTA